MGNYHDHYQTAIFVHRWTISNFFQFSVFRLLSLQRFRSSRYLVVDRPLLLVASCQGVEVSIPKSTSSKMFCQLIREICIFIAVEMTIPRHLILFCASVVIQPCLALLSCVFFIVQLTIYQGLSLLCINFVSHDFLGRKFKGYHVMSLIDRSS